MPLPLAISIIITYVVSEVSRMISNGLTARRLGRIAVPFCRFINHPSATVMCIGDSTAVGTGAQHSTQSVAGRLAHDFPDITIINHGINGASSADLVALLTAKHPEWKADLLIIHIGGIDIMGLRSLRTLRSNIASILRMAKHIAPRIILVTPPDLGSIPYFRFPLSLLFSWRAKHIRDFALHRSKKGDFIYIDLYTNVPKIPAHLHRRKYFAADRIHPSGDGYALWYIALKQSLEEHGWTDQLRKS
ncbi:MAG: hypothetical protein KA731_00260 [Candidatus Moranbacteria bacterium]|nr:hypothetical protein [Candidatus Moranbacteria bacterium]MBP6033850.1 hypothetical protein [Candidatus Moranbacteria bacterium]MBP7695692.1 hypothetical protein [Candidatus Moranbacteria bacterium]